MLRTLKKTSGHARTSHSVNYLGKGILAVHAPKAITAAPKKVEIGK